MTGSFVRQSPKGQNLRLIVGAEFRRNNGETDEAKVEELKFNAVRGLSNYLLYEAASKDEQMKSKIAKWQASQLDAISKTTTTTDDDTKTSGAGLAT